MDEPELTHRTGVEVLDSFQSNFFTMTICKESFGSHLSSVFMITSSKYNSQVLEQGEV